MGLGKTVEGIGGIFLREILALHHNVPPARRASVIVCPNAQVMEQWGARRRRVEAAPLEHV